MASDDWYRNKEWNDRIEEAFFGKLNRARDKAQYLRIQASYLSSTKPNVALRLLEQYFRLPDNFDHAQALVDRASAYISLGDIPNALESYEAALRREEESPKLQTQAYLDLPFLIATRKLSEQYDRCLEVLNRYKDRNMFPVDVFRWHAAKALVLAELADMAGAKDEAIVALAASEKDKSGFRYHPAIGLVGDKYPELKDRLVELSNE